MELVHVQVSGTRFLSVCQLYKDDWRLG